MTITLYDPDFWASPGFSWRQSASRNRERWRAAGLQPSALQRKAGTRRDLRMRLLAAQVTSRYGRVQVMEWYLNSTNYGHYASGRTMPLACTLEKPPAA